MITFDFRSTTAEALRSLSDLQKKQLPEASRRALAEAGRYVAGALRSELQEKLDVIKSLPGMKIFVSAKEADEYLGALQQRVIEGD